MEEVFSTGDRVRVREDYPPGHIRTPYFIRGKTGEICDKFGEFKNPELLAYRLEGPKKTLYWVRFRQVDIWPDYDGPDCDTVDIDIYDHWLKKA